MPIAYKKPDYNQSLPNIVTGMEPEISSRAASTMRQPIRNIQTTIQVLNDDDSIIDTITGHVVDGTIHYSATSLTRRTGSLKMIVDPEYMPSKTSVVWFNKRFRVYQGIVDLTQYPREAINFLLGTFWVSESSLSISEQARTISLSLSDKMAQWDGLGLEEQLKIQHGTPMSDAMRGIMELIGETEFGYMYTSDADEVMPYDYKKEVGTPITDIIEDFRDMYMDFICGYNVKGQFEYRKIEMQKKDETRKAKWDFNSADNDRADLTLSFDESYNLQDVKNRIVVVGSTSTKTGYTPKGTVKITDADNKFNVDAIGMRTKVIQNNDLTNDLQCVAQARYELWKSAHFQEKVTIDVVPVYAIQPNDLITVTNPITKKTYRYMVDNISVDLGVDGLMTIDAHKMYYVGFDYGTADMPIVAAIKNGIEHLGWLSLAEQRIKDCYGISGDGKNTLIIRFVSNQVGGEQASTTAYLTSRNQTMELDIKDFEKLNLKNENGDVGRSKGDYVDRVLGHEMFHAVCNDFYGAPKTIDMPIWFKEGFAELLHGAKERYQSITGYTSNEEKKQALIERASRQLNGAWESTSEDYVSAYLIAATMYYLCGSKEELQAMFQRIEKADNVNLNFLYKALPLTGEAVQMFDKVIQTMQNIDLWKFLNDPTDPDTCSIGGNHMLNLYGRPLNAEDVFNNEEATCESLGFKIRYDE
ncbi:DUF5048 domain-containing protein [Limosilactobacillus fermentum]|uniref:DUF5048 domain-containing protein n=1 Tax=Limosilactobacillus fermentum TaxID=1613 RepID=UPI001E49AC5C|nr:flagellin [Limosilactobacillus fermentum]MCD5422982.1 flagellin [Limosilactobacillus fermentum]